MTYSGNMPKRLRPLNADTALERLKVNARAYGFQHDGKVYFTSGWSPRAVRLLERNGLVENAGNPEDLRRAGITVPEEFVARRATTFYAADLNLISETVY